MTLAGSSRAIRILVVDDHPMLREGVAAVIQLQPDMEIVGEAVDGRSAVAQFAALRPDVTLMDIQMPVVDGLSAIEQIRALDAQARIIVLTTYAGDAQAVRALKAGAAAYILKSSVRRQLLDTIRAVHDGDRVVQPEIAQEIALHSVHEKLSPREIDILRHLARGESNRAIAQATGVSEETVKGYLKSIFQKLHVRDRTLAVTVALRRGIITL